MLVDIRKWEEEEVHLGYHNLKIAHLRKREDQVLEHLKEILTLILNNLLLHSARLKMFKYINKFLIF